MANELVFFRQALGMSRDKLARELGGSTQNLARYESEMPREFREKLASVAERMNRPDLAKFILSGDLERDGAEDLAAAIEALIREWRRGSEKWKYVAAELGDEGIANEEAHAKGRTNRPARSKAG